MNLDGKEYCDHCKKEMNVLSKDGLPEDYLWQGKDGKEYCSTCYSDVFYPKHYGFTRSDFRTGKAGWTTDENGNPVKIHE